MKLSLRILVVGGTLLTVACGGKKQSDYSITETKPTELVVDQVPILVNLPTGWKDSPLSLPNMKKWEAPAGTFDVAGGETWRVLEGSFTPGTVVGITVEPAGGSPQPTTDPIVAIET